MLYMFTTFEIYASNLLTIWVYGHSTDYFLFGLAVKRTEAFRSLGR